MKKNLIDALKNADAQLSASGQVKIDSEIMGHISGGKDESSGRFCTISGECNVDGSSCYGYGFIMNLLNGTLGGQIQKRY